MAQGMDGELLKQCLNSSERSRVLLTFSFLSFELAILRYSERRPLSKILLIFDLSISP